MKRFKLRKWIVGILILCMMFTIGGVETLAVDSENKVIQENDDPGAGRFSGNIAPEFFGEQAGRATGYTHDSRFDDYIIKKGIDVSKHNGEIDWNKVKKAGIEFAFIRVAYRGYGDAGTLMVDPMAKKNLQGAIAAEIPVGVYIFSQAITEKEAIEEAELTLKQIQGFHVTMPVVMDVEFASDASDGGRLYKAKLSKAKQTSVCRAFAKTVSDNGYMPMIYANKDMLENHMNAAEVSSFSKIWLARYGSYAGYKGDYEFWQYTPKGKVDGITGNNGDVDMNFWYVEDESLFKVSNFSVAGTTTNSVSLQWRANKDADGYQIYRKTGDTSYLQIADIADGTATSYRDRNLSEGRSYYYKVRAYTNSETGKVYSEFTTPQNAITRVSGTELRGRAYGVGKIKFTWEKVSEASGYQIQKITSTSTTILATVADGNVVTCTLSGFRCNTNYKLRIRAYKTIGGSRSYSVWSPEILVKTSGNAIGVVNRDNVYVRASAGSSAKSFAKVNRGKRLTVTGSTTNNWYRVSITVNGETKTGYIPQENVALVNPIDKPILSGDAVSYDKTKLTWSKATRVAGYEIQRYSNYSKRYKTIKTITSGSMVSYTDPYLNASETFKYRIRAYKVVYGTRINGPYSEVKAIKTKAPRKGIVTGGSVNVRSGAGLKYSVLKKVKEGTGLTVTGNRKDWYRISISVNGKKRVGYISKAYVKLY